VVTTTVDYESGLVEHADDGRALVTSVARRRSRSRRRVLAGGDGLGVPTDPTLRRLLRVAIYIRISTDEENQPWSLGAQHDRLVKFIETQEGWELAQVYPDECSGATTERPQLQRALRDARAGRFDVLLVYRVDRLARSLASFVDILKELKGAGVSFRSATEPFDTSTAVGTMMLQMLAIFAEYERATIIDRITSGMERKAAAGGWNGGGTPFGYKRIGQRSEVRLEPCDEEAVIVRMIFRLYADHKLGSTTIADRLNDAGHRTRKGRLWTAMGVIRILCSRAYIGELYWRGKYHASRHEPLVTAEVFEAAQALLRERGEDLAARAANKADYLLSRTVVCARCGHHYVGLSGRGKGGGKFRYYICGGRRKRKRECDAPHLPAPRLEEAIVAALNETFTRPDFLETAFAAAQAEATSEQPRHDEELAQVETELSNVEKNIAHYQRAFEAGTMPDDVCGPRVRELGDQAAELRRHRDELRYAAEEAPPNPYAGVDLDAVRAAFQSIVEPGDDGADDGPARAALLRWFVHEVRVESAEAIYPRFRVLAPMRPTAPDAAAGPAPDVTAPTGGPQRPTGAATALGAPGGHARGVTATHTPGVGGSYAVTFGGGAGYRTRVRSRVPRDLYERSPGIDLTGVTPWDQASLAASLGGCPARRRGATGRRGRWY